MIRRAAYRVLSALGWLGFNAVTVWTVLFLAGVVVPRQVDGPARTTPLRAIVVDAALLLLFAVQHSVMARQGVKRRLARVVPAALERTTYVFATNACLVLLLLLWEPFGGRVWHVGGPAAVPLWVLCGAGWLLAVVSTYAVDHLELIGLRQTGWGPPRSQDGGLQIRGLYAVVRHPLMTGLLVAFWATPRMGAGHLLFALLATGYVLVGVRFEERDLRRTFGADYEAYAARVPALVPGARRRTPTDPPSANPLRQQPGVPQT